MGDCSSNTFFACKQIPGFDLRTVEAKIQYNLIDTFFNCAKTISGNVYDPKGPILKSFE